jgi:hypothetical protein
MFRALAAKAVQRLKRALLVAFPFIASLRFRHRRLGVAEEEGIEAVAGYETDDGRLHPLL